MTDTKTKTRVKIGLTFAPREVELEVEDGEAFAAEFEAVVSDERKVWWVTDHEGHHHGLLVDKVAYVDIEPGRDRTIGFG
jgi:hypothetical protein